MSEIKAGDLVIRVKGDLCCGNTKGLGVPFIAGDISVVTALCRECGQINRNYLSVHEVGTKFYPAISRLKKIPPLSELEEISTQDLIPNEKEAV